MRLKEGFIRHEVSGEYMLVAAGEAGKEFHGLVRNNKTADYIFELLMQETTEEEIVKAVCARFHADETVVAKDVHQMLEKIREAGFLKE